MDYTQYVNIETGTASSYRQSHGNTLPLVQVPFGMQAFVVQTDEQLGGWYFNPHVSYAEGVRISQQPSPWLGDYGQVVMMPQTGIPVISSWKRHSALRPNGKKLKPHRLELEFARYDTSFKLVPTLHGAKMKLSFLPEKIAKHFLMQCFDGESHIKQVGNTLYIETKTIPKGPYANNFSKYYRFDFSEEIKGVEIYQGDERIQGVTGKKLTAVALFDESVTDISIDVTASFIGREQLDITWEKELKQKTFCEVEKEAHDCWNKHLGTIVIEGTVTERQAFYSNLYRCFTFPHCLTEYNGKDEAVHQNFYNGKRGKGPAYADMGFWDTYRTVLPLIAELSPSRYRDIIKATIQHYRESGWLPRWLAPYERGIMPSTLVDSAIAEAIVRNAVAKDDLDDAIAGLLKNGTTESGNELHGRKHITAYLQYGYVPSDISTESVSMTLDNVYSDYAISKALRYLGRIEEAKTYEQRSLNYQKLFRRDIQFFAPKKKDGSFDEVFSLNVWGTDFCESSAWSNNFSVFHDIPGVIKLFGGEAEAKRRLDTIFSSQPKYEVGRYGFEIHEMTEMASINLGHFAISNQPSFYLPFVYAYLGEEALMMEQLKKAHHYFSATPTGYPGDEDNGSLSAWYIFTCIGKYPFIPVEGTYITFPALRQVKKMTFLE